MNRANNRELETTTVEDTYPLSALQQGMLFNTLLEPGSGVDVVQILSELHEALDVAAFLRAWRFVVARHPVLRTSFRWQGLDHPRQEVHANAQLPWTEQDWRGIEIKDRDKHIADFLDADRRRGFNLACAPLFRVTLLRHGEADFHLIVTFHHAVLDGRSYVSMILEVFKFYETFRSGGELVLPLPRPYRDYIRWSQQQDFSKSEAFWRNTLKGFTAPTPLVVDHPSDAHPHSGTRKGILEAWLSTQTTSALRSLAHDNHLTLNTIVQGAWGVLLSRYSGDADVVFGVVRSTRRSSIEGAEAMIGLFINTLPLRLRVNADAPLLAWLREVRLQWTALQEHEQTPLAKVHAWSDLPLNSPLFHTTVVFENYRMEPLFHKQGGAWLNRRSTGFMQTIYPVGLGAYDGTELSLRLDFDRRRVGDAAAARMLGHLRTLLEGIASDPQRRVGELALLNSEERQKLLVDWNQTQSDYPRDRFVDELFEDQVRRTPDNVAVVFNKERLSYRELNEQADQIANRLRVLGVGRGVLVGLYVERSLEMLAALLGILKAGGAYIPLDPTYPSERLAFMLEDARPAVLLTQESLRGQIAPYKAEAALLCLDALPVGTTWDGDGLSAHAQRHASDLAYVLYTSGSTGHPNGVQIPHRALVNLLCSMQRRPGITAQDTLLAVTTLSFDIAALELFLPLISGARVVIAPSDMARDGCRLSSLMELCGATVMQATPATWRLLLEAGWNGSRRLKLLCGGEAWSKDLAEHLLPRCQSLWNMYGPTETTIWSSVAQIELAEPVLIGPPIANTTFYVLQADCQPAPIGIPGELHIGGDGLARGYLNRPELTKDRFVDDPFHPESRARLYKTGDLVRYLSNGNLQFLARTDDQIKIRGLRIEPGEIETAIASHPAIRATAVMAREDVPGDKRLVAYLVATHPPDELVDQLRALIRSRLPEYMLPTDFVCLDALPLTPNGKIDRKSLPVPDQRDRGFRAGCYVAPRNDLERSLATAWEKVLGAERVGIRDNFFDLGGDSLGMIKLALEMEQATGIDVDLGQLFDTPTIAELLGSLGPQAAKNSSLVIPLRTGDYRVPIFCLVGIDLYAEFAESLGKGQPVFGVYVAEEQALTHEFVRGNAPEISVEKLAQAYYRAILRVRPQGPYRLAGLSLGGIVAMELASKMRRNGADVDVVMLFDTWLPEAIHHRWLKWLSLQAATIGRGHAWPMLVRLLTRLRTRLATNRLNNVDNIRVLREAAFVHSIKKWRADQRDFDFRVLLFRASDRREWGPHVEVDADYGWRRYLGERISIVDVDGDHLSMLKQPNVVALGRKAQQYLLSEQAFRAEL